MDPPPPPDGRLTLEPPRSQYTSASPALHEDLCPLPVPIDCAPRPLSALEAARVATLSQLQFFLATAPTQWTHPESASSINKFSLPNGETVSCVLWNGLYHITGTDIVRALAFRFEAFGRPVLVSKKWEEGVFSDLRNLKPGVDACLEEPKSPLLDFLFRNGCIRTQKKQKVFYWFSVPHDRLFLDALERDLKREKAGMEATTTVIGEPARSFRYDPRRTLFEQFAGQNHGLGPISILPSATTAISASSRTTPLPQNDVLPIQSFPAPFAGPSGEQSSFSPVPQMTPVEVSPYSSRNQTLFLGSQAYKQGRSRSRRQPSAKPASVLAHRAPHRSSTERPETMSPARAWTASPRLLPLNHCPPDAPLPGAAFQDQAHRSILRATSAQGPTRTYVCPYETCRRSFKRLEHLKRHARTHTNERPFQCDTCTRSFGRLDNLAQHVKVHEKSVAFDTDGAASSLENCQETLKLSLFGQRSRTEIPLAESMGSDIEIPARALPYQIYMSNAGPPFSRAFTAPPDWSVMTPSSSQLAFNTPQPAEVSGPPIVPFQSASRLRSLTPFITSSQAASVTRQSIETTASIPVHEPYTLSRDGGFVSSSYH